MPKQRFSANDQSQSSSRSAADTILRKWCDFCFFLKVVVLTVPPLGLPPGRSTMPCYEQHLHGTGHAGFWGLKAAVALTSSPHALSKTGSALERERLSRECAVDQKMRAGAG